MAPAGTTAVSRQARSRLSRCAIRTILTLLKNACRADGLVGSVRQMNTGSSRVLSPCGLGSCACSKGLTPPCESAERGPACGTGYIAYNFQGTFSAPTLRFWNSPHRLARVGRGAVNSINRRIEFIHQTRDRGAQPDHIRQATYELASRLPICHRSEKTAGNRGDAVVV